MVISIFIPGDLVEVAKSTMADDQNLQIPLPQTHWLIYYVLAVENRRGSQTLTLEPVEWEEKRPEPILVRRGDQHVRFREQTLRDVYAKD